MNQFRALPESWADTAESSTFLSLFRYAFLKAPRSGCIKVCKGSSAADSQYSSRKAAHRKVNEGGRQCSALCLFC